jgi:hypothetical protein
MAEEEERKKDASNESKSMERSISNDKLEGVNGYGHGNYDEARYISNNTNNVTVKNNDSNKVIFITRVEEKELDPHTIHKFHTNLKLGSHQLI